MQEKSKLNVLLVDDQPGKLLTYDAILQDLGENLLRANSGREALEHLLKNEIAVVLVDVCMPDLDGFQLAAMIREHPRFSKTAIIFISAIHLSEMDRLRGYEMGAVDYVPVPVIPEVLRAKVKIFCELYRKTRELENMNVELERRVHERTAELEAYARKLEESERGRSLALAAGNMGSWEWDRRTDEYVWDDGQFGIFGVDRETFSPTSATLRRHIHADDWIKLQIGVERLIAQGDTLRDEFRVIRPDGEIRWCIGVATGMNNDRISGVTIDITDRKLAEEKQALLAREVDHRAKNALALVQSIIRLTKANDQASYIAAIDGRIRALSVAHNMLAQSRWIGANLRDLIHEELAPYSASNIEIAGPNILLQPSMAQTLALALHELATNAAKYGALSCSEGSLSVQWMVVKDKFRLQWVERGGPPAAPPKTQGFGSRIISASIERQLHGQLSYAWEPEGMRCEIVFPLTDNQTGSSAAVTRLERRPEPIEGGKAQPGNRVLLVEDEALVTLVLTELLSELGYDCVGPCASVPEALHLIDTQPFDMAVLDVNLRDEFVYPVAQVLMARDIPFIFITGYAPETIDPKFEHIPILQKPLEPDKLQIHFPARSAAVMRGVA